MSMNPPTPQSPEYPGQNAMKLVHPFSPHNCHPILYTHRTARTRDGDKCGGGQGFDAGLHCLCMSGLCRRRQ